MRQKWCLLCAIAFFLRSAIHRLNCVRYDEARWRHGHNEIIHPTNQPTGSSARNSFAFAQFQGHETSAIALRLYPAIPHGSSCRSRTARALREAYLSLGISCCDLHPRAIFPYASFGILDNRIFVTVNYYTIQREASTRERIFQAALSLLWVEWRPFHSKASGRFPFASTLVHLTFGIGHRYSRYAEL